MTAAAAVATVGAIAVFAQTRSAEPNWKAVEDETMRHYQAAVRIDTTGALGAPPP